MQVIDFLRLWLLNPCRVSSSGILPLREKIKARLTDSFGLVAATFNPLIRLNTEYLNNLSSHTLLSLILLFGRIV